MSGISVPRTVVDDLKKTNIALSEEVLKLRAQVEALNRQQLNQQRELERSSQQVQNAMATAGEETAKSRAAKEVIKSLTAQLYDRRVMNTTSPHTENGRVEGKAGTEWVEQDEPGVYVTVAALPGGGKDFKRVRFSRKRFSEQQAEKWWADNRQRVDEQYNVRGLDKQNSGVSDASRHGEEKSDRLLALSVPLT